MIWNFKLAMPNSFGSGAFQSFRRPRFCLFTLYISIMYHCRKNKFTHYFGCKIGINAFFCCPESFACKSLFSGNLSTFLPLRRWLPLNEQGKSRTLNFIQLKSKLYRGHQLTSCCLNSCHTEEKWHDKRRRLLLRFWKLIFIKDLMLCQSINSTQRYTRSYNLDPLTMVTINDHFLLTFCYYNNF